MRSHRRYFSQQATFFALSVLTVLSLMFIAIAALAHTPSSPPADARGVIRLRVRVKSGETTKGLSRKRFFLIRGTLEQNKALIQSIEQNSGPTRECFYRNIGASEALIKWLRESDCESVYCREIAPDDLKGSGAVPEFQRAFVAGEQEFANGDLARKWLTINLPENLRDGYYKARQRELQKLITQAEGISGSKVLSVMTDTKGTAYFTELPVGTYVLSNLLPAEIGSTNVVWNCEMQVKPGDLASEKPFLISNVREKNVKCVGIEKPQSVCDPAKQLGQ